MTVDLRSPNLRFGPFQLDRRHGELRKFGRRVRLQEQPLQVLLILLEQPGEIVTREQLQQSLWKGDTFVDFDHGLNNAIKRLREALNDSAEKPRYIETVPRRGYRFTGIVEADQQVETEPKSPEAASATPHHAFSRTWTALFLALVSVVAVFAYLTLRRHSNASPEIRSIAVLPMQNLSGDPEQDYFAAGVTDALTTELSQINSLRVSSRTSTLKYTHTTLTVPEIARALNVDAVIEGSVIREGGRVRITAQLIQGSTDKHLWAHGYERDIKDVLSLESEVATEITRQVAAVLTPRESTRLQRPRSVVPQAYDLYFQARYYSRELNRPDNDRAIALLEKAVSVDPQFGEAYSALAVEYRTRGAELNPGSDEWNRKAFVAAERAIALDPESADGYVARATLLWTMRNHFPHEAAVAELKHALALNPNSDEAHNWLAYIYYHIGLLDKAEKQLHEAVALDPSNPTTRFRVSVNLVYQGRYEDALIRLPHSRNFMPSLWAYQTAFSLVQLGRVSEAADLMRDSEGQDHSGTAALLRSMEAIIAATRGDTVRANQKIAEAIAMGSGFQHFHHVEYGIASAYALMNQRTEALQWLKRAANDGFPCYPLYERDRNLANLRHDPEFIAFMEGLRRQWQHYRETL